MAEQEPTGLCGCGCGQRTDIATVNHATRGWVKGQPKRFVHGHNARLYRFASTLSSTLCGCGCGQFTQISTRLRGPSRRERPGQAQRFIKGHHVYVTAAVFEARRKRAEVHLCECGCGTRTTRWRGNQFHRFSPGHHKPRWNVPYSAKKMRDGTTIKFHRIRAENALGHPLPPTAVVHHPDKDPWNPDARLVICQDQSYHMLLHRRMRERLKRMK